MAKPKSKSKKTKKKKTVIKKAKAKLMSTPTTKDKEGPSFELITSDQAKEEGRIPLETRHITEGTALVEPPFVLFRNQIKVLTAQDFKGMHKGLLQMEEMEEQVVQINHKMECYPLDGIVQVNRAIEIVYGFSHAKDRPSFFGPKPPLRLNIKIGLNESVHAVFGAMAPPAWESGFIQIYVDTTDPLSLQIAGQVKRKFEPKIKEIVQLSEKLLRENSIYRGQAVELDLNYVTADPNDEDKKFDPGRCAPRFIDLGKEQALILPRDIEMEMANNVWNIIKAPEHFRTNNVPIKGGVLLDGPPGTGKTLTAYQTAKIAVGNKWTYIYLRVPLTADTFLVGYRLAQLYGPSIFFVEDCDVLFGKERDEDMNRLLETLDGVTAKTSEVIVIFTTNFPERLNDAFTRSGRINHQISFRAPDAEAAGRFVQSIAGIYLSDDIDLDKVGIAFQELVPADIQNGIDQAKKFCIGKNGVDIEGKVDTEMLCTAAEIVQRKAKKGGKSEHPDTVIRRHIGRGAAALIGAMNGPQRH